MSEDEGVGLLCETGEWLMDLEEKTERKMAEIEKRKVRPKVYPPAPGKRYVAPREEDTREEDTTIPSTSKSKSTPIPSTSKGKSTPNPSTSKSASEKAVRGKRKSAVNNPLIEQYNQEKKEVPKYSSSSKENKVGRQLHTNSEKDSYKER